jgi:hypothetical protein
MDKQNDLRRFFVDVGNHLMDRRADDTLLSRASAVGAVQTILRSVASAASDAGSSAAS